MAGSWTPRQKRCYHRVMSGLTRHQKEPLRFITLTMPVDSTRDIRSAWHALKERIRRRQPGFAYIKIQTSEGNGVLHIMAFGGYISHAWLSANWEQLTGAKVVDIRLVKSGKRDRRRVSRYVVTQYVAEQQFDRMSWSWAWVFKGFCKFWQAIKQDSKYWPQYPTPELILHYWHMVLLGYPFNVDNVVLQFKRNILPEVAIDLKPSKKLACNRA